jgi:hypothetical protein
MQWISCCIIGVIAALSCVVRVQADDDKPGTKKNPRTEAASILDKALTDTREAALSEQTQALRAAVEAALKLVPAHAVLPEVLATLERTSTESGADTALRAVRSQLADARDALRFERLDEAPLPEGFPEPAPVDEIRVQDYPQYRLAKTEMTFFEGNAFWTLFNHIKKHDIAMTAPVEMQYTSDSDKPLKRSSMAFLYRSTEQGTPGVEDKVEVLDIPPQLAVSIGVRGDATKQRVAEAKRRLEAWLEAHATEYEAVGPLRVLGYNSPFVADEKRLTEVQIPVRAKTPAAGR